MTIAVSRSSARAILSTPKYWHALSLAFSTVFLASLARHLWFFSDEWDFLIPSNDAKIFAPHVGHWSTTPILATQALRDLFGIDSYWPYIALSMAVHLLLCHVLWRIMLRIGVNGWIATALGALLMLLGAGSENILWGFQFGFMGAVLLGLTVVLLLDVERVSLPRSIAIELLAIWSLTSSGTALPLVLAASFVSLHRHGLRSTLLRLVPVAMIYGLWYLTSAVGHFVSYGPTSLGQLVLGVPSFVGHEFVDGLGSLFPYRWFGVVLVIGLIAWLVFSFRQWRSRAAPAFALAAAAVAQATLTALTRVDLGVDTAASGRYVYVLVALLLPLIGVAVTWLARDRRWLIALLVVLILVVTAFNSILLTRQAASYATMERSSRAQISAALSFVFRDHEKISSTSVPSPNFARDLDMGDLEAMYERGWIHIGAFDESARLSALANLRVTISSARAPASQGGCRAVAAGSAVSAKADADGIRVSTVHAVPGAVYLTARKAVGDTRYISLSAGWSAIRSDERRVKIVVRLFGPAVVCAH